MTRIPILAVSALVAMLALAVPALGATPTYKGTVGPGFTIKLAKKPTKAGKIKLVVSDKSDQHNFHLSGPGVNVKTSVGQTGTKTFTQDVTYQMPGAIKTVQHNATVLTLLASAHEDDGLSGGNTAMGNKDLNVADPSNAPTQYADDEGFGRPFTFKLDGGAIKIDFKGTYTVVYMP